MTIKEYTEKAMRTKKLDMKIEDIELGMIGEFGEFVDALKKIMFHNHSDTHKQLIKEAGDFTWYFFIDCEQKNITVEYVEFKKLNVFDNIRYCHHVIDQIIHDNPADYNGLFTSFVEILNHFNISLEEVFKTNVKKLSDRYPEKYTDENSIKRVEYSK